MASPSKAYMSAPASGVTASILPEQSLFRIGEVSSPDRDQTVCAALLGNRISHVAAGEKSQGTPPLSPRRCADGPRNPAPAVRRRIYHRRRAPPSARTVRRNRNGADGDSAANGEIGEAASSALRSPVATHPGSLATINRKVLLDLRDTLRAFLTLLETE